MSDQKHLADRLRPKNTILFAIVHGVLLFLAISALVFLVQNPVLLILGIFLFLLLSGHWGGNTPWK